MTKLRLLGVCGGLWATVHGNPVVSQEPVESYPSRPVTVVAPIAPGGPIDLQSRVHVKKMTELTGQPFVLDFKPGAGGTIGITYVVKAAPDGYTLLVQTSGITITPATFTNLPYDVLRDLAPITKISDQSSVLLVRASFPAKNFAEFLAHARVNPGKVNYATTGPGGVGHLSGAWIARDTNTEFTFVHYKGASPLLTDLMSQRLDVTSVNFLVAMPLIKAGKARPIAVMRNVRSKLLPDVQTVEEQGVPGYSVSSWTGFFAPSKTPVSIVNKLSTEFAKVVKAPEVIAALERDGIDPAGTTPMEFRQILATDLARWAKLVQETGVKLN